VVGEFFQLGGTDVPQCARAKKIQQIMTKVGQSSMQLHIAHGRRMTGHIAHRQLIERMML
jgi:hypothetical protein